MRIRVLGSAAGGGFPQWNCSCHNCDGLRRGTVRASARSQSSMAVSCCDQHWVLLNASPDVLAQIRAFSELQPARGIRDTALSAVVLLDSQIDHTTGLLMLREGGPLAVYCTDAVRRDLTGQNPLLSVLEHYCGVQVHRIAVGEASGFTVEGAPDLAFTAVPLKGKAPPYSSHRDPRAPGTNIGLRVSDRRTGGSLFYAPGLAEIEPPVRHALTEADCVMVDGTFWTDDELMRLGISSKRASEMGHLPQSGPGGMIEVLRSVGARRKILIHINNTNPILDEDSAERARLDEASIEVAYDGMEIVL